MPKFGKLTRVDLREFWPDEARDFTPWLAKPEHLQLLGRELEMDLELAGTEQRVGVFKADLLAKDLSNGQFVIIENQLERTNHDHLGKLITYASGLDAKAVIWIAKELSEEHRKALEWLNNVTGEAVGFFGVEIQLWQIDESLPAPKFEAKVEPNEWAKSLAPAGAGGGPSETKVLQFDFWTGFIGYAKSKGTMLSLRKPRPQHWYSLAIGRSKFKLSLTLNTVKERIGCELYISHPRAKDAFAKLMNDRDVIEKELGASLDWMELPQGNDSRIVLYRPAILEEKSRWNEYFAWMLAQATAFHASFGPRVRDLDLGNDDSEEIDEEG